MQLLKTHFKKNSFTYTQLERTNTKALYSQHDEFGDLVGHEIFFVKVVPEYELGGNIILEHEKFPSDVDFGKFAWSVGRDINVAMDKYNNIEKRLEVKDEQ